MKRKVLKKRKHNLEIIFIKIINKLQLYFNSLRNTQKLLKLEIIFIENGNKDKR